jgi:hypothetical protein
MLGALKVRMLTDTENTKLDTYILSRSRKIRGGRCCSADPSGPESKAWVCGLSPTGIAGLNPAGGMDVCCQVEISATG